jgi:hypothetical protein
LPPETKQLEDFVENLREKDTNQQKDPDQCKRDAEKRVNYFRHEFLPEEGLDSKKITALRFQQFEQEDEKYRKNKD